MKRICVLSILALIVGCTARQIDQLRTDEQSAERVYTATTQATAVARDALNRSPTTAPGRADAARVVAAAEKGEQTARLALDVAKAALVAVSQQNPADPVLHDSLALAISAIPSPWTPMLASLIPAAIPLLVSVIQSVRLGRAHQTVVTVTQQLQEHKAALDALNAKGA